MALLSILLISLSFSISISSNIPPYHPSLSLSSLLPPQPLILPYHKGPLIIGPGHINVYIIWYGDFTVHQKSIILDFFKSFNSRSKPMEPSVRSWWWATKQYKDTSGATVARRVRVAKQTHDERYSLGHYLSRHAIQKMVRGVIAKWALPIDRRKGIYLVLTAEDVGVDRFCVGSCGYHETLAISNHSRVMFGWIGNARKQCVGECAWPFGVGLYGPPSAPLGAPNGDVGIDGMIINIATILAGTATNPFNNGYFQGDRLAPLEAVTACAGIFGPGAYPGYPGEVLVDPTSNGSFNTYGVTNRRYMLPAMWSPSAQSCRTTMG